MSTTQDPDPFGRPPVSDPFGPPPPAAMPADGPSGPRAGFWQRFGAYLIDVILLSVIQVVLRLASPTLGLIASLIISIAYFTMLEGGPRGQTVGKMALGIRVIDLSRGGSIGYGRAMIRWFGRIISAIVILLGYLWMLWDPEKQTWHDKFAGSVVVPVSAYPVG